jgi:GH43 family beta-xylosidase
MKMKISYSRASRFWRLLSAAFVVCVLITAPVYAAQTETFRNPLNALGGADPWLVYHEGYYYLATTTWTHELTLRKSPTLAGLKTATPERIYYETDATRCCNMWAPEFHLLDGADGPRWYFYYTAGTTRSYDNQHMHVLESAGTDPMGPYTYKARLYDPEHDAWAIDGSILQLNDSLYFLFSAWEGRDQSIFIAPMSNPWTLSGSRVLISSPTYDWERTGLNVNEGPVALYHEGDTFIIYSASFCGSPDYKLGMLTYNGGDPLSQSSWDKSPEPVFERSDENGVFGPGHNGFFTSPDGTENWIVYHANDSEAGGCNGGRTTRVQPFSWNEDGTPDFGVPASTETELANPSGDDGVDVALPPIEISRFRSFSLPAAYIRHQNYRGRVDVSIMPYSDSEFIVVPGLADASAVSLESANFPGWYLRHSDNQIWLDPLEDSDVFRSSATWWQRPGLADSSGVSFEVYSSPDSYIQQRSQLLLLFPVATDTERAASTFVEER